MKMDMILGIWNVRNPCESEPLKIVARESAVYRVAFMGVQITGDNGRPEQAQDYIFSYGKGTEYHHMSNFSRYYINSLHTTQKFC
jgi:hypothetical protein